MKKLIPLPREARQAGRGLFSIQKFLSGKSIQKGPGASADWLWPSSDRLCPLSRFLFAVWGMGSLFAELSRVQGRWIRFRGSGNVRHRNKSTNLDTLFYSSIIILIKIQKILNPPMVTKSGYRAPLLLTEYLIGV